MGQPSLVSDAIVMISSLTTVMLTVMKSITEGITVPSLRGLLDVPSNVTALQHGACLLGRELLTRTVINL